MFCTECGAELPAGQEFCTNCGASASVDTGTRPPNPKLNPSPVQSAPSGAVAAAVTPPAPAPGLGPAASAAAATSRPVFAPNLETPRTTTAPASHPSLTRKATSPRMAPPSTSRSPILLWGTLAVITLIVAGGGFYFYRAHLTISDASIVQKVEAKFFDDVNLHKCTIDVTAQNGIVTLVGLVNSEADKTNAVRIAGQQKGVKQVVNQLVEQSSEGSPSTFPGTSSGGASRTIEVPGNQAWTATGIFLNQGTKVEIVASGGVSMGGGWQPMPPAGRPPNCEGRGGFPAGELPCWSLIGRIGEQGAIFYVGSDVTFQAPDSGQLLLGVNDETFGDNSGNWLVKIVVLRGTATSAPNEGGSFESSGMQPMVGKAVIQEGGTSLQLPQGRFYLYGMVTGGGAPSSPFATGQFAQAVNAAGQLSAALAYGNNNQNSYATQTGYQVIGGVSVSGSWDSFNAYYGSISTPGASSASVNFSLSENALVAFIGLAASQQEINLQGIPGLKIDALNSGPSATEGMVIAHAYLKPGAYTVIENSAALSGGQEPQHMADLIGVFVFGSKR